MKRTWKKTLAALMALTMVLSLCIIPASAEGETDVITDPVVETVEEPGAITEPIVETEQETQESEPQPKVEALVAVAQIGETTYATLAEAIAAASADATITLLADATLTTTVKVTQNLTIEGAFAITAANDFVQKDKNALIWVNGGTLTLKNKTVDARGECRVILADKGKLTIDGTHVTGGDITDGYIAGVYVTNAAAFEMKSGAIDGNTIAGTYAEDGYLQYSADLWIGANAKGTLAAINGGTVGNVFVNSNEYSASNPGAFTLDGGTVENLYVEYDKGYGGSFTYTSGALSNLYLSTKESGVSVKMSAPEKAVYTGGVDAQAKIGNAAYTTLADAVTAAQNNDTITILGDITFTEGNIVLAKTLTIDLNGHTITGPKGPFRINKGGHITLTGTGTVQENASDPVFAPFIIKGSANANDKNCSSLTVGKDVTLKGGMGVMIDYVKDGNVKGEYGITVNVAGTLVGTDDTNGGVGIYINGSAQDKNNCPVINISPTAKISGVGGENCGIYAAGYAVWNITGGTIEGDEALSVKSGEWHISGGTFHAKGTFVDPAVANNNGSEITGAAFGITSTYNKLSNGKIIADITGGTFISNKGCGLYVGHSVSGGTETIYYTTGLDVKISGGTFTAGSEAGAKAVYIAPKGADDANYTYAVSGGTFSTDPTAYLASGYSIRESNGSYVVYRPSSGGGSGSTVTPPKTETETSTEGNVTTKTETTTTTNKDGSKTTEVKETATNVATGEKTESKVTETVAKDGSVTKEEVKTTTAADGAKTEEKTTATVDAKTGTSATTTVKTDETGRSAATIVVENSKDAKKVTLSADAVKSAAGADEATMTVKTAGAEITLDASAIAAVADTKGETVAIAVEAVKAESLPGTAKETLKDAVVVDLTISVGANKVSSFNGGKATVSVPYTKSDSTKVVAVYYVDDKGAMTRIPGATYDEASKSVIFTTGHFSFYAMVEETPLAFTDVKDGDWYYDAVRFVTGAQLFNGTGATTFGPGGTMTREMLATVLYRKAGSPAVSGTLPAEFTDGAAISVWAGDAMGWAVQEGILTGVGENRLDSQGAVTRQQLAVILYRAAGSPQVGGMALSEFADGSSVAEWAVNGMTWAVENGVITGRDGNALAPTGTASRAEVATMLMRIA